jgi:hypothetical protein
MEEKGKRRKGEKVKKAKSAKVDDYCLLLTAYCSLLTAYGSLYK